jgi:microcystin-dependent protein
MSSNNVVRGVPAGVVIDFSGSTIPEGYLLCDGSEVSRTTYARLFTLIGTTYGAGDGSTTFRLPDCRGRISIGVGQGSGLTNRVLAAIGGAETHILTEAQLPSHTHTQNSHSHGILSQDVYSGGSTWTINRSGDYTYPATVWSSTEDFVATNNPTGLSIAHPNMQPYLAVNKMIKF